jgi:hypothetical protein
LQSSPPLSGSRYAYCLSILAGPLIAGLAVYLILSYLFVPLRVTIPLAIIISVLIFGLSGYYIANNKINDDKSRKVATTTIKAAQTSDSAVLSGLSDIKLRQHLIPQQQEIDQKEENHYINKRGNIVSKKNNSYTLTIFGNLFFVVGYAACLLIVTAYFFIFNPSNEEIFIPWEQFTIVQIAELGASIALCFFLPGYALLSIFFRNPDHQINPILKILLAYLLSILVTGLTGYVAASAGFGLSDIIGLFIFVYLSILIVLLIQQLLVTSLTSYNNQKNRSKYFFRNLSSRIKTPSLKTHISEVVKHLVWDFLKRNSSEFIVFGSLFALVVLSTCYLYDGVIIGDQWYHHGRSLTFMSGQFRDISIAGADNRASSPFPNALLAAFFSISGIPSVNAYASIGFLNIIPVLSFYYFFKNWVPIRMKKAALLACTLFMLSSGFGWVYVLDLAITDPPESQPSTLQMLFQAGIKSIDIIWPTSFSASHPDFSTPLIFMALPTGFTLLGLLREREIINNKSKFKFKYLAILLSITFLGTISHDEFYLFIIVASIVPIFLFFIAEMRDEKKKNLVVVYGALLAALLLTLILATYSFAGVGYFIFNTILGIPILVLSLIFVAIMCILYIGIAFFYNLVYQRKYRNSHPYFRGLSLSRPRIKLRSGHRRRTIVPGLVLVFVIAWLYVFTFVVWSQLSVEAVEVQTRQHTVPWYLYPMKLGVMGLLGFAFVLSYLFGKFEKEIFIFGIIVVVAFVIGPYHYEHRFNKYIMAGLVGFGSLFIYNAIIKCTQIQRNNLFRTLSTSLVLGIVIFSSALSVLMFWGYNASAHDSDPDLGLGRRDFPSASEFGLYRLLANDSSKDPLAFNVAGPEREYNLLLPATLFGKVYAFSGIPWPKLTQSPLTLDAYTLESFYDLLSRSDTRYIVLPKENFVNLITESGKDEEMEIIDKGRQQREDEEVRDGGQGQLNATLRIGEEQRSAAITDIIRFAIQNFKKAYEDSKYLVLAVPPFSPSQSQADIGFVHRKSELLASQLASDNNAIFTLPYNRELFKDIGNPRIDKNEEKNVAIYGIKDAAIILRTDLREQQRDANYFESTFRIVRQNNSEQNYAGIIWNDTNTEYTLVLGKDTLEVSIQSTDVRNSPNSNDGRLVYVREINRENGAWYTIKIMYMERTLNIYVNNVLAIQIPTNHHPSASELYQRRLSNSIINANTNASISTNTTIHGIGLYSVNNVAEFRPIKVGEVAMEADRNQKIYFEYYYPLSMLALSKLSYDTFLHGDMSALSKKIVILNLDSVLSYLGSGTNGTFTDYLKFVNRGGTLVIMNIDDIDFFGKPILFRELFDIRDEVKFDSISYEAQRSHQNNKEEKEKEGSAGGREDQQRQKEKEQGSQYLNVSGVAREIVIRNNSATSDVMIKSYYVNSDNQKVAPFAIEKKYGTGRLIFVNNGGYFDSIAKSPQQTFLTLAKTLNLAGLDTAVDLNYADNRIAKSSSGGVMPITQIVGDLQIHGNTKINSSSFSIVPDNKNAYRGSYDSYMNDDFYVQSVMYSISDYKSISRNSSSNSSPKSYDFEKENHGNNGTLIEGLRLSGPYEVIISLNGSLALPSPLESHYNYVGTSIATGSDIVVKLHNGSTAEFVASNESRQKLFKFSNDGEIHFYNVRESGNRTNISVLLKSPEIRVTNGKINFEDLYNIDYSNLSRLASNNTCVPVLSSTTVDCRELKVNGKMVAILNHVDNYRQGIGADTVSYIKSLEFEQNKIDEEAQKMGLGLKLPADVSQAAKERGITVPWQKALFSDVGVAVSISMFAYDAVIAILIMILWRPWAKNDEL